MATERIDIIISEKGSRTVKRNLGDIGTQAAKTNSAVNMLKGALASLGAGLGVRELVRLADTYTTIQNRLKTVVTGTSQLKAVTAELLAISNRTRQSFEGTAEVYARLGLAAKDLGVSQQEVLQFTESLNQAVALSGASSAEATAGMIQLSQGLASGALRGDELRSVLEQLPAVADVIAKGLGVTRGELRKMGEEGKITAQVVLDAFAKARGELAENFANTVPTVSQALTVLRNNFMGWIGELDSSLGITRTLAETILFLSENMGTLARIMGAIGFTLFVRGIQAAVTAVYALTAAIAANPLGALAIAITATIGLLIAFADQVGSSAGSLTTLADVASVVFSDLVGIVQSAIGILSDLAYALIPSFDGSFSSILMSGAAAIDGIVTNFQIGATAIASAFANLPAAIGNIIVSAANGVIATVEGMVNGVIGLLNFLPGVDIGAASMGKLGGFENTFGSDVAAAVAAPYTGATDYANSVLNRANANAQNRAADAQLKALADAEARKSLTVAGTATPIPGAGGGAGGGGGGGAGGLSREDLDAANELERVLERQDDLLKKIKGTVEEYKTGLSDLDVLFKAGKINVEEYNRAFRDLRIEFLEGQEGFAAGAERSFLKIARDAGDAAANIEGVLSNAFSGAEDALVEFVMTGKADFRDLATSIIEDLIRMQIRQGIIAPISQALGGLGNSIAGGLGGGLGGGILGGLGSLLGFATGSREMAVGGAGGVDSQLVAFRASPGERVKVSRPGQEGNDGSGGASIVFNINTPDAESFKRSESQIAARMARAVGRGRRNM